MLTQREIHQVLSQFNKTLVSLQNDMGDIREVVQTLSDELATLKPPKRTRKEKQDES